MSKTDHRNERSSGSPGAVPGASTERNKAKSKAKRTAAAQGESREQWLAALECGDKVRAVAIGGRFFTAQFQRWIVGPAWQAKPFNERLALVRLRLKDDSRWSSNNSLWPADHLAPWPIGGGSDGPAPRGDVPRPGLGDPVVVFLADEWSPAQVTRFCDRDAEGFDFAVDIVRKINGRTHVEAGVRFHFAEYGTKWKPRPIGGGSDGPPRGDVPRDKQGIDPENRCPTCNRRLDAATHAGGADARPKPGDYSVCIGCASPLVFTADGRTEAVELADVATEARPELERAIAIVHRLHDRGPIRGSSDDGPPRGDVPRGQCKRCGREDELCSHGLCVSSCTVIDPCRGGDVPRECHSRTCNAEAQVTVHWPGQTIVMCRPCALRAFQTATAMGFTLTVEQLGGAL